jgi:phosphoribosylaminoimidazolecarboxamide formyltransferase/IMP cyclohydrolase
MLDGRVKSLHPAVFGGILADRDKPSHRVDVAAHGLPDISVVVANLYPFWEVRGSTHTLDEAVALIDVGGVAVVRAAAKNFRHVTVLTDPAQYERIASGQPLSLAERRELAHVAFRHTAAYDTQIARYLEGADAEHATPASLPETLTLSYRKVSDLKYGLNPHQKPAALYSATGEGGAAPLSLLNGQWGYINVLDAVNAWGLVSELSRLNGGALAAASFKHTIPTGAAVAVPWENIAAPSQRLLALSFGLSEHTSPSVLTYARARNADPLSSFGDFIGFR